jgi:hypothetical protein
MAGAFNNKQGNPYQGNNLNPNVNPNTNPNVNPNYPPNNNLSNPNNQNLNLPFQMIGGMQGLLKKPNINQQQQPGSNPYAL